MLEMTRKIYYWKLRSTELQLGERTLMMGVLNVTPDSFSDGGRYNEPDRAYARALELEEQGADIIDIGAESTKPGSQRISADEEWQRLVPVLKRLRGNLRTPLSLDTYKSETAERALQYGVEIFNDPTGLTFDPNLAKVAANANAGLILNHMRGLPESWAKLPPMKDVVGTISHELEAMVNRARHSGVERTRIVVDPGLGFGKRKEQNAEILAHLELLAALDYPILVGPSRKSFLAQTTAGETVFATAAAVAACVLKGAHIVRVHDVKEMRIVIQVAEEIARAAAARTVQREERPLARPGGQRGPNVETERPRPPRPPISGVAKEAASRPRAEEENRGPAGRFPERRPTDGRERPQEGRERPQDGRERPRERRDRQGEGHDRPREGRERKDGATPPVRREFRPAAGDRPFKPRFEPRGDKRSGPPRSGPPRSGPPRSAPPRSGEDRFRPFDQRGDRNPRGDSNTRGARSGGKPPKRPFRKRP